MSAPNLAPCPFCGAGTTRLRENGRMWTGQGMTDPVSVSVEHWCEPVPGQPGRMIERVGRDEAAAVAAWNRRAAIAAPEQPEWECKAGGLRPLTQAHYEAQPDKIKQHYSRIAPRQTALAPFPRHHEIGQAASVLTDEQIDAWWRIACQTNAPTHIMVRTFARHIAIAVNSLGNDSQAPAAEAAQP